MKQSVAVLGAFVFAASGACARTIPQGRMSMDEFMKTNPQYEGVDFSAVGLLKTGDTDEAFCSAVLLGDRLVVTAKHCGLTLIFRGGVFEAAGNNRKSRKIKLTSGELIESIFPELAELTEIDKLMKPKPRLELKPVDESVRSKNNRKPRLGLKPGDGRVQTEENSKIFAESLNELAGAFKIAVIIKFTLHADDLLIIKLEKPITDINGVRMNSGEIPILFETKNKYKPKTEKVSDRYEGWNESLIDIKDKFLEALFGKAEKILSAVQKSYLGVHVVAYGPQADPSSSVAFASKRCLLRRSRIQPALLTSTDCNVTHGDSGGPVLRVAADGTLELVGIVVAMNQEGNKSYFVDPKMITDLMCKNGRLDRLSCESIGYKF